MNSKYNTKPIIYIITGLIILFILSLTVFAIVKIQNREKPIDIQYVDSSLAYHKVFKNEDSDLKNLKKQNKLLYDSLKKQQKEIDELMYFKYRKSYKVINTIKHDTIKNTKLNTYTYSNLPNDSLEYNLKIVSETQPVSYELNMTTKDKILIVNKKEYKDKDINHLTISTSNKADISSVATYKKNNTKHKLHISPTLGIGYGFISKKPDLFVGVGLSYNF